VKSVAQLKDVDPEGGDPPCWAHLFDEDMSSDERFVMPRLQRLIVPDLAQPPGYAHVVVATGTRLVTTAGAMPLDDEGNLVGTGNVHAQARQTLHNLMRQLAVAGANGEDVLKTTVYVASTDRADLIACWEEVQRSPLAAAASTLLGVALLGAVGQLVEIEAIAVLP